MRIASVILFSLLPAAVLAAPASKPATEAAGFSRGATLPKWVAPLTEIPRTERTDPLVVRASDTQAWVGPVPAVNYQRAIQVNDSSALGAIGQFGIDYYAQYQKLALHKVVILRGEQRIDHTGSVNIRPLQRETQIDSGILGGATTLQLLLADVRIGDTLWISYTVEGENPVRGKTWSNDFGWDASAPTELKRLTVLHPRNRPLQWRQLGDFLTEKIAPQVDLVEGMERIRFESRGLEAIVGEPSTPADYLPGRLIQFSEYADWQDVATWADGLFPKLPATPALKALVAELRKKPGQTAQAEAALRWVQDEIRYFSVSIGENAQRPHAPDEVLKRRYGDCKDKSYLLISLLRELGITARPVLLSASAPRVPAKLLATSNWFNHVIVEISLEGRDYYVDPTRSNQPEPLAAMPTAFPGAAALVVDKTSRALTTLPARADVGPRFEHIENIVVPDFSGAATLETRDIYRGTYADAMRLHFTTLSANEQKNELLAVYEKNYPGVSMTGAPKYQDDSSDNRVEIVSRYQLPKAVINKDHGYSIDFDSKIIAGTIGIPDKLVRKFPFELAGGKFHGRYRLRIRWPDSARALLPDTNQTLDNPFFHVREDLSVRGNQFDHLIDYRLKQAVIPAADLLPLQEEAKKLQPIANGAFRFAEANIAPAELQGHSFRNLDDLRHVGNALASMSALKTSKPEALIPADACQFVLNVLDREDIASWDAKRLSADLVKHLRAMGSRPGVGQCMGQLAFAAGDFDVSTKAWAGERGIADDSPLTRQMAWSQFYSNDSKAAVATMARYQAARSKAHGDSLSASDVASQIALLQRAGEPLPAALEQFARAIPDGPWPRPVLAMQIGLIRPEQLIEQAEALPGDAGELALNDAWFYIGQARLAAHDEAGAARAFRWYQSAGVRSTGLPSQAKAELRRLIAPNPGLEAGRSALRAKELAAAVAAWRPGADAGLGENQLALGVAYLTGNGVAKDTAQALHWIGLAAGQDVPEALFMLGMMHEQGTGVVAAPKIALDWLRKAAALNQSDAQYQLGYRYRYGRDVERDAAQALRWYRAAAEQSNSSAMASLGEMYGNGEGTPRDYAQAEFWMRRAAFYGDARAIFRLAQAYAIGAWFKQDYVRSATLYRLAADLGSSDAQLELGYLFENGFGVKQDMGAANGWYRKAADAGNPAAQDALATSYWEGKGVSVDLKKALEWFSKAAAQGKTESMVSLGYMQEHDIDGGRHYVEARRWYERAAEQNNSHGEYYLALLYKRGNGVPADQERMRYWYLRSAEHGNSTSQYVVGTMYSNGDGVPVDRSAAAKWLGKAAQQGRVKAQSDLGLLYLNGNGVERDLKKAAGWLRQAADEGDMPARSALGRCYEHGWGLDKDPSQALFWYQKAANAGSRSAQVRLAELYLRLKQDANAQAAFLAANKADDAGDFRTLARYYMEADDIARAEQAYLSAITMAEKKPGEQSADLVEALKAASQFYVWSGKFSIALPYAQRALDLMQAAGASDTAWSIDQLAVLGDVHIGLRQPAEGESLHLRALAINEKVFGRQSDRAVESRWTAGEAYFVMAQFAKAEDMYQQAYAMQVERLGETHSDTVRSMHSLGKLYLASGRYKEAESMLLRVVPIWEKQGESALWATANTLKTLGTLYDRMGKYEQAEAVLRRALAFADRSSDDDNNWYVTFLNNLSRNLVHSGKYAEAEQLLRRAQELRLKARDGEHVELAAIYQIQGEMYAKQQRHADAERLFQHALTIRERTYGPEHIDVAESLHALGVLYNELGRYDAAALVLERALAFRRKVLGTDHPDSKASSMTLASTLRKSRSA